MTNHHIPPRRRLPSAGKLAEWGANVCPVAYVAGQWPQERMECEDCYKPLIDCRCSRGE